MVKHGWDEFALLLIDVQNDFWDQAVQSSFPDFPDKISGLLSVCRLEGLEVIHVRAVFSPDQSDWMVPYRLKGTIPCISGTEGAQILDCAREIDGEKVFNKQTFDSFVNPDLHQYLQESGKRFLLTAGLVTSVCVLLTTASAVQRGYLVSLVEDGCADYEEAHQNTLRGYRNIFMPLVAINEITTRKEDWLEQLSRLAEPRKRTEIWTGRRRS